MAVHYAGIPCRIDEIHELAREHGLRVIEDAAHAFGSRSHGRLIGTFGDLVCFSFGPVKIITSLEGGASSHRDPDDVQRVRELRLLGVDTDRALRTNNRMWDYDVVRQGWRYHMGSMQASVGLAQLALIETFIENRRRYCRCYNERFADFPEVVDARDRLRRRRPVHLLHPRAGRRRPGRSGRPHGRARHPHGHPLPGSARVQLLPRRRRGDLSDDRAARRASS